MLFPGGGGGLVGGVVVEVPVLELDAGGFEVVAVGDEAGGDGDGAVEELFGFGVGLSLALGELVVLSLGGDGEFSELALGCLLYTSPSPRDQRGSRMPSSA